MHILIVHDNDQDGYCAAHITRKYYSSKDKANKIDMATVQDEIDWDNCTADHVYFLDHTPSISRVKALLDAGKCVTLVDHHPETKAEFFSAFDDMFTELCVIESSVSKTFGQYSVHVDITKSTAMQTWEHFYTGKKAPYAVTMIDKWDTWNHNEESVLPFHYGLSCLDLSDHNIWDTLLSTKKDSGLAAAQLVQMGGAVGQYWLATINELIEPSCWIKEKDGYKFSVCNAQLKSTYDLMAHMQKNQCIGAVWFWKNGTDDNWSVAIKLLPDSVDGIAASRKETLTYDQLKDSWF